MRCSLLLAVVAAVSTTMASGVAVRENLATRHSGRSVNDDSPHLHIKSKHKPLPVHVISVSKPLYKSSGLAIDIAALPDEKHRQHELAHPVPPSLSEDESIEFETNDGQVAYQVVIDKVGHGVAPDEPAPPPEYVVIKSQSVETWVKTARGWVQETVGDREPVEFALIAAVVVMMGVLVVALARQQQRAYEAEQVEQTASQDLESGETSGPGTTDIQSPDADAVSTNTPAGNTHKDPDSPQSVDEGSV